MQNATETAHFDFELPSHFIASRPLEPRDSSKLLVYHQKEDRVEHKCFHQITEYFSPGDLLTFNNSKVFPSRMFGKKITGGNAEILLIEPQCIDGKYLVMLRSNGKKNPGDEFDFHGLKVQVDDCLERGLFWVKIAGSEIEVLKHFNTYGMVAIPPYIRKGMADELDVKNYQTVYAKTLGSVAAPTAGLHFTHELLQKIKNQGVDIAEVTLHVGPGTFLPIEVENYLEHKIHAENYFLSKQTIDLIKKAPKKIFAVGTTTLRVLETCHSKLSKHEGDLFGETDIFLHPGKKVHSIDALITNFHLPKSSLLLLVSSLIGQQKTMELYQLAMKNNYRFYSYGDAMLILRDKKNE